MDLALSQAIERVRHWETKATTIRGSLFTHSQELQIAFTACASIDGNAIRLRSDKGFKAQIMLTKAMTFRYGDAILEIMTPGWRCILYEPRD